MSGTWSELKNMPIIQWDKPSMDPDFLAEYKQRWLDMLQNTYFYGGGSGGVVGSPIINPSAPCNKCSEGLLKLDFLKESKDNYCGCSEGQKLRNQFKKRT